jgi:hypothetical protein
MALEPLTNPNQFRKLPLLLSYSQVLSCGVPEHDFRAWLDAGLITFIQLRKDGRRRYRKKDLAHLLGLEM